MESKLDRLGTSATSCRLHLPQVIMRMENLVEWRLVGETKVLAENLSQRHFVHHKSHFTRSFIKLLNFRRYEVWILKASLNRLRKIWRDFPLNFQRLFALVINESLCGLFFLIWFSRYGIQILFHFYLIKLQFNYCQLMHCFVTELYIMVRCE
jgi:hypothetical protein